MADELQRVEQHPSSTDLYTANLYEAYRGERETNQRLSVGEEAEQKGLLPFRPEYTKGVWMQERDLGHIICRSYLPVDKCDECALYHEERLQGGRTRGEVESDHQKFLEHLHYVRKEKRWYYTQLNKARQRPSGSIIDGTHQSKYHLRSYRERSIVTVDPNKLNALLKNEYGVLPHGRTPSTQSTVFSHTPYNASIQCIWKVIIAQYAKSNGCLPPVLFLQLDQSMRGSIVQAFLSLLVEHGVFERIHSVFLPMGHTLEEIDHRFSHYAPI